MCVMCGTCRHDVTRFSAISAHSYSSRLVKRQLSSESAGRVSYIKLMEMLRLKFSKNILCRGQSLVGVTSQDLMNHGII